METVFPTDDGFFGQFILGFRKAPGSDQTQRIGTFVLKRNYSIVGSSLVPNPAGDAIRLADSTFSFNADSTDFSITDRENDLAIFKPQADLIVLGAYQDQDTCSASVTPPGGSITTWLSRSGDIPLVSTSTGDALDEPDPDAAINMFGLEQRIFARRFPLAGDYDTLTMPHQWPIENTHVRNPLPLDFDNGFFNSYRRHFANAGSIPTHFIAGSEITIRRDSPSSEEQTTEFVLGDEVIGAMFYVHEDNSPDRKRYWCKKTIDDICLDTLVVEPDFNRAHAIWRGVWNFDDYPNNSYRLLKVNIMEGA